MGTLLNRRRYMGGGGAPVDWSQQYLTFKALENGTFKISSATEYSLDKGATWTALASNTNSPTISAGNTIMWRATLTPASNSGVGTFSSSGKFEAMGNPLSLIFGNNFAGIADLTGYDWAFARLFRYCSKLYSIVNISLPATTLSVNCYREMFAVCTSISEPTVLPALTMKNLCYYSMFDGSGITRAPDLPATSLAQQCYCRMFQNAKKLVDANITLSATQDASMCYSGMFINCEALINPPVIESSTTDYYSRYQMFEGCKNMEIAPVLKPLTLGNMSYSRMFYNCSKLRYIKAMFTSTPTNGNAGSWVGGVASEGVFVKNSAATWNVSGANGVPEGWTVQTASE